MAKIDVYENSKFATLLSGLGWIGLGFGAYACLNEELGWKIGIISLAISFALKILAFLLDRFVGQIKRKLSAKEKRDK